MIRYKIPDKWDHFDFGAIATQFIDAKAAVQSLKSMPYQRDWVEQLQEAELRREVAGTSRIEGADFTEKELDEALKESPEELHTRSQRQAHAVAQTYRWIRAIPDDRLIDADLILQIHRRVVTGADEDHCPPGELRTQGDNVNFGTPRHRGADGGAECEEAFARFVAALQGEIQGLDPLLHGLAAHYHLAAMHPFVDGNGRTARALEILFLQRAGLRDICFISISNYYYEEKAAYLRALSEARENDHDLTPFFNFTLRGIAVQANRLLREIKHQVSKAVYSNLMYELFEKQLSPRKRVIADRQLAILELLLERGSMALGYLVGEVIKEAFHPEGLYGRLKRPFHALARDLSGLEKLGAISTKETQDNNRGNKVVSLRLQWPEEMTEGEFYKRLKAIPKANPPSLFWVTLRRQGRSTGK